MTSGGVFQRIVANKGGAVRRGCARFFHHDPAGCLLFETDAGGDVKALYAWNGAVLAAKILPPGGVLFYHFDQVGGTVALTDDRGEMRAACAYTPFGAMVVREGDAENDFTFGGAFGVMDDGGGLYFMRNRTYDAAAGCFIQRDPAGLAGGMNPYAYAENNPLALIDPHGFFGVPFADWKFWVGTAMVGLGTTMLVTPTGFTQITGAATLKIGALLIAGGGALDIYSTATSGGEIEKARGAAFNSYVGSQYLVKDPNGVWKVDHEIADGVLSPDDLKKIQAAADWKNKQIPAQCTAPK